MPNDSSTKIPLKRGEGSALLEKGIYQGKIEAVDVVNESPSGYPYLKLRVTAPIGGERVTMWTNVSLAPGARFKMDQLLDAIGAPLEGEISPDDMKAAAVVFEVKVSTWEGQKRNEIDKFLKPANVKPEQILNSRGRPGAVSAGTAAGAGSRPGARRPVVAEMSE